MVQNVPYWVFCPGNKVNIAQANKPFRENSSHVYELIIRDQPVLFFGQTDAMLTVGRRNGFVHLTVSHFRVVVSVGQQHIVQSPLQAGLCSALEEDVVRKGPVHVWGGGDRGDGMSTLLHSIQTLCVLLTDIHHIPIA